jgi:hypothetical protein
MEAIKIELVSSIGPRGSYEVRERNREVKAYLPICGRFVAGLSTAEILDGAWPEKTCKLFGLLDLLRFWAREEPKDFFSWNIGGNFTWTVPLSGTVALLAIEVRVFARNRCSGFSCDDTPVFFAP